MIGVGRILKLAACCAFVAVTGCIKISDSNQAVAQTRYYLGLWSDYIRSSYEAGIPINGCKTLAEAMTLLDTRGVMEKDVQPRFTKDAWGRRYAWSVTEADGLIRFHIVSSGRNGVFENGEGDDLSVEIDIPRAAPKLARVSFKPP
jgi:hypothetical protein